MLWRDDRGVGKIEIVGVECTCDEGCMAASLQLSQRKTSNCWDLLSVGALT